MDCRRFVDSGCLGYLIAALCSEVEGVRALAGSGLELFTNHLDGSRFKEKMQVCVWYGVSMLVCVWYGVSMLVECSRVVLR